MDNKFRGAIAKIESNNNPNAVNVNNNGTIDKGTYQLNSSNFPQYNLTSDSPPQAIDAAAIQHMDNLPNQIGTTDPNAMALAYHSGPNTSAISNGQINQANLTPEQTQYLNNFQNAYYGGGANQPIQTPASIPQPYLPQAQTTSLNGAYVKPNLLNILSGLAQVGGGMATDIIQARKRMPVTGGGLIENGQNTLQQQQQIQAKYNQAQNVLQYLNDPNIDNNTRSLAAGYLQAGNPDAALGVLHTAQQQNLILNRQNQMAAVRGNIDVDKALQEEKNKQALLLTNSNYRQQNIQGIMQNEVNGTAQPDDQAKLNSLVTMEKKVEPALDPSKAQELQKTVSGPVATSYALNTMTDYVDNLYKQISTGRLGGRITNWSNYVQENPQLAQAKLVGNMLRSNVVMSQMGESARHAFQLEQILLPSLPNDIMTPKELKAVSDSLHQQAAWAQQKAGAAYLSLPQATPLGMQYLGKKLYEGYKNGAVDFGGVSNSQTPQGTSGNQQGAQPTGQQNVPQQAQVIPLEKLVELNGGTIKEK